MFGGGNAGGIVARCDGGAINVGFGARWGHFRGKFHENSFCLGPSSVAESDGGLLC